MEFVIIAINELLEIEETQNKRRAEVDIEAGKIKSNAEKNTQNYYESRKKIWAQRFKDEEEKNEKKISEQIKRIRTTSEWELKNFYNNYETKKEALINTIIEKVLAGENK